MNSIDVILKLDREKPLLRRHPWIFSNAIDQLEENLKAGDLASIYSHDQKFLGQGFYSPGSQILFRLLSFQKEIPNLHEFFHQKIKQCLERKKAIVKNSNAFRVINSESDGLPGLVADLYADRVVCGFSVHGMGIRKKMISQIFEELLPGCSVWEKNDQRMIKHEQLSQEVGRIGGSSHEETVEIYEGNCKFLVNLRLGQKTGFYLDQRENRFLAGELAEGHVLNCFAYTGGFGIHALKNKAKQVTNIEISKNTAEMLKNNFELNCTEKNSQVIIGDCFDVLRKLHSAGESFDFIILDPPKFAHHSGDLRKAAHAYKDLNRLAFNLLKPEGKLMTFSCSGRMDSLFFQKIISGALIEAGRDGVILKSLGPSKDHTLSPHFPEGQYLKGFLLQVK